MAKKKKTTKIRAKESAPAAKTSKPAKKNGGEGKLTIGKAKKGRPTFVFTKSSWLINLDEIACARLRGNTGKLTGVDVWFRGQNWPEPALKLRGEDADALVGTLWRRSYVKRHFVQQEMESED